MPTPVTFRGREGEATDERNRVYYVGAAGKTLPGAVVGVRGVVVGGIGLAAWGQSRKRHRSRHQEDKGKTRPGRRG